MSTLGKTISSLWLPVLIFAILANVILFGLSYWLEITLVQGPVTSSMDLVKSDRQLKSMLLSCVVFLMTCLISSVILPKRYLRFNAAAYIILLNLGFLFFNRVFWASLCNLRLISERDPFFLYWAESGGPDPGFLETYCYLLAFAVTVPIFWLRRRAYKI